MDRPNLVLETKGLHHWFGSKHVLHNVEIQIVRGQIVSLVGPSGCGKSTLLRALLGTHPPCSGRVILYDRHDRPHHILSPGRDRGIVYQRYALFPFLTAQENVAIGPKLDETTIHGRFFGYLRWRKLRQAHMAEAAEILEKLGLKDSLRKYPHELSGGMQQRVAIGQALIMKPSILLLDEPFGALDEATREDLQLLLLGLYEENLKALSENAIPPHTILIVTHELNEAIYVGDRVIGLSQYWDWKGAGHQRPPGATIVYDKPAPIYSPGEQKEYETFISQRQGIRGVVFEPELPFSPDENCNFWEEVDAGRVGGVLVKRDV